VETYRKVVRFVKKEFPVDFPVSIRRLKLSDKLDGDCYFNETNFEIRINNQLPEHEAIETLIHEYAHVLSWKQCVNEYHGDQWGKFYSRIYRKFLKTFVDPNAH